MNKRLIILTGLLLMTAYQGYIVSDALAIPGEFETMWAMDLPRVTYFIGESVTFTVVAFASTDPTLMLPDQMAKITIRNESLAEVYEVWITTNVNGSAPVTWETGLEASAGNYTIILDDLKGDKVVRNFMLLFNEETYWQTRVDLIQEELDANYGYINYLFSYQKFLEKKVIAMERQLKIFGALTFITVMCGIYVAMHEAAMTRRTSSGLMSYPGKFMELMGFRHKPIVELDHEIIADAQIPLAKRVPIYGHVHCCPICDPDKTQPMTEGMLRDHLWAQHDRLHLKKDSIGAKWRARKAKSAKKSKEKANEPIKPAFASVEKYQEEWAEEKTKEHFQARLDLIKRQVKRKQISQAEAKVKIAQLKEDLQKANEKKPVYKETEKPTSPKPELQRKVRMEKQHLKAPPKVVILDNNPLSIASYLEDHPDFEINGVTKKTSIDELYDRLKNEKVN
jgi:hypothetical protein